LAKYLRSWGPAAAWAAVLFLLSSIHGTDGGPSVPFLDKIAHCVLYAVLGAALARGRSRAPSTVPHAVLLVLGALYGISDEWHQSWVPGRDPDPADWLADVVGLAMGYGTTMWFLGRTNDHGTIEGSR
jgi:VanZ family protein